MTSYRAKTRLYVDCPLPGSGTLSLSRDQSHYVSTVMRQTIGAPVLLFNGRDGEWAATLAQADRKQVTLSVETQIRPQAPQVDLWYVFAPLKKARIDYMVQKATEMGASRLQPVFTQRTVADRVNTERLLANAIEAAEQTERLSVPEIGKPVKFSALLDAWPEDRRLLFCDECAEGTNPLVKLKECTAGPWAVLVGPEGGFDDKERDRLLLHPATEPISLGPRVLRADTAAVAALTLWQATIGDW